MKRIVSLLCLVSFPACFVGYKGARPLDAPPQASRAYGVGIAPKFKSGPTVPEIAAPVLAWSVLTSVHDTHHHGSECGCPHREISGQTGWWYRGQWEYESEGTWYALDGHGPAPSP